MARFGQLEDARRVLLHALSIRPETEIWMNLAVGIIGNEENPANLVYSGVLAVGGGRNGGQELTLRSVQTALMCQEMVIVGDGKPSAHFGGTVGGFT